MPQGEVINPPLYRNIKHDRGFHHDRTGFLLCPAEYDWSQEESVTLPPNQALSVNLFFRVKEKLRSGELAFSGDVWPNFVYHGHRCDHSDVWAGLFRSALLITVR